MRLRSSTRETNSNGNYTEEGAWIEDDDGCEGDAMNDHESKGWAAVLDGDREGADLRSTRAEAERDAVWLRNHPARHDRQRFGLGGHVAVHYLERCEWTGEMVERPEVLPHEVTP